MNTKYIDCTIKTGIVALSLLIIFLASKTITEIISWDKDEVYPTKTITINAEGEAVGVADIASFSFSIEEEDSTSDGAQKKAAEKYKKAFEYLKSSGVDEKDIKTEYLNVAPKYENVAPCYAFDCPAPNNKIVGYTVSHGLRVKVRDSDNAGKFIGELAKFGINNISGIAFTIDEEEVLYDQARNDAIAKAKVKAEKLAEDLDVRLGDIISFSEDPRQNYGMREMDVMKSSLSVEPVELAKGQNTYKVNVYLTYELK